MKGLILKDLINLMRNVKIFGLLTVFYIIMSFSMDSSSYFGSMFTLVFAMLIMTTYSYDEAAKWDGYALTMPISKENIIQGKYLVMLLLTVIGCGVSSVISIVLNIIMKNDNIFDGFQISAIGAALVILFYCITIPFITKLGIEKARFVFLIVYIIPFFVGTFVFREIKERYPEPPESLIKLAKAFVDNIYIIVPLMVLSALWISYQISIRIYRKKEF